MKQCHNTIKTIFNNIELITVDDTDLAAKHLVEGSLESNIAILCSELVAINYGLDIINNKAQNIEENITTFIIFRLVNK